MLGTSARSGVHARAPFLRLGRERRDAPPRKVRADTESSAQPFRSVLADFWRTSPVSPMGLRKSLKLARLEGLEPPTIGLEGHCSIQLSYRRVWPLFSTLIAANARWKGFARGRANRAMRTGARRTTVISGEERTTTTRNSRPRARRAIRMLGPRIKRSQIARCSGRESLLVESVKLWVRLLLRRTDVRARLSFQVSLELRHGCIHVVLVALEDESFGQLPEHGNGDGVLDVHV